MAWLALHLLLLSGAAPNTLAGGPVPTQRHGWILSLFHHSCGQSSPRNWPVAGTEVPGAEQEQAVAATMP